VSNARPSSGKCAELPSVVRPSLPRSIAELRRAGGDRTRGLRPHSRPCLRARLARAAHDDSINVRSHRRVQRVRLGPSLGDHVHAAARSVQELGDDRRLRGQNHPRHQAPRTDGSAESATGGVVVPLCDGEAGQPDGSVDRIIAPDLSPLAARWGASDNSATLPLLAWISISSRGDHSVQEESRVLFPIICQQ
jgi:hypothetical protein